MKHFLFVENRPRDTFSHSFPTGELVMMDLWNFQVRVVPLLLGLAVFGFLHLLRRITKIEYTPSYFAVFPLSLLDYQLSEYFGEFFCGEYKDATKRGFNKKLFIKALISFFLTFFGVPFVVGSIAAFLVTPRELWAFLILLLMWQAVNCIHATIEFAQFRRAKTVWAFFGSFYLFYLVCLVLVIRYAYRLTYPFSSTGDLSGLLRSVETSIVQLIIEVVVIAVLSGLFTHWLLNKDPLKPTDLEVVDIESEDTNE